MNLVFPRISGEDFNNACIILLNVIKNKSSLDSEVCQYNSKLKAEVLAKVKEIELEFSRVSQDKTETDIVNSESLEDVWLEALGALRDVRSDKDASSTTKLNAIKYIREISQELDYMKELKSENEKIGSLTELVRQFFTRLLDDKSTVEPSVLSQEFLNRLKELLEDVE